MLKLLHHPRLGTLKMGRKRPEARGSRIQFHNFLCKGQIPTYPAADDYSASGLASLRNVYLNNQLGDCVIAGLAHVRGVTSGNADGCVTFTNNQITQMYSAVGGYVPGDPSTDQGCNEQTALQYFTQTGFPDGVKLAGWMGVDPSNSALYKYALHLFENLIYGVELPDAWVNNLPQGDGFVWDVAGPADPSNGHCFIGYGYGPNGVSIDTWGMFGLCTDAATKQYCAQSAGGELYVAVSPDMIAKATMKAPNGLDWPSLIQAFDSYFGGNIPVPVGPAPAPSPVPLPPTPPSPTPAQLIQQFDAACALLEAFLKTANRPTLLKMVERLQKEVDFFFSAGNGRYSVSGLSPQQLMQFALMAITILEKFFSNNQQVMSVLTVLQTVITMLLGGK